jgi:hypothetical protein
MVNEELGMRNQNRDREKAGENVKTNTEPQGYSKDPLCLTFVRSFEVNMMRQRRTM